MRMCAPVGGLLTALAVVFGTAVAFAPVPRITWEHRGEGRTVAGAGSTGRGWAPCALRPALVWRSMGSLGCWVRILGPCVWTEGLHCRVGEMLRYLETLPELLLGLLIWFLSQGARVKEVYLLCA